MKADFLKKLSLGGFMEKYVCKICGYVYDPEEGDSDGRIEAHTAFEDIPDDWVCPLCGVKKSYFEVVTE